jgi:hypothetical protein
VLSNDPPALRRACLVAPGGLTPEHPAAVELRRAGWDVRLFTPEAPSDLPPDTQVREFHGDGPAERSDRVRHALEPLHRERRFGLIAFAGAGGLGARAIQAKRAGLAFDDVPLVAYLDGNSQRDRERNRRWPSSFAEVEGDYLERFAFENADAQILPDPFLHTFVRGNHWAVRRDVAIAFHHLFDGGDPPVSEANRDRQGAGAGASPLVTVAIAHHNLGRYFPDTLATLAAQSYPNLEVIAIDDGSTDSASVEVFESMRAKYPAWTFLRQENAGIGATRNRILELAKGEFFIPVDADNLARPDMVAKFVTAIQRNPQLAAMSCYFLAFDVEAPTLVPGASSTRCGRPVGRTRWPASATFTATPTRSSAPRYCAPWAATAPTAARRARTGSAS